MKINSSLISPLSGKTFVLELGHQIRFKAKQQLINYLQEQNAHISYILTASTDYVLVSNDVDTYKTRRAKQLGIPLVHIEYINECRSGADSVDIKKHIVTSAEDRENFAKSGTIAVSGGGSSSANTQKPVKIDVSKIKIWNSDDVELPQFDELTHAELGRWAIFKETNEHSEVYFALELQIIRDGLPADYRIRFRYEKQTITKSQGKLSLIQYAFSNDINELHQLFASYYNRIATMPRITRIRDLLPDKLGSKLLLRSLFVHRMDTQMLDDNVCQLIESLWTESIGDLNELLTIEPETIALQTIIEAEAALLEIKSESKSAGEAEKRFYSLIPHRQFVDLINNRHALIDKLDLCQMLRDMVTVNELTNWSITASIEAKYRALKCHIETLDKDSPEYSTISETINSSTNADETVIIHQIYSVAKQTDALNFRTTLSNQRQLFHGSKYKNFLGILSRGLLMPKVVVNDLGITRTDVGCLGYGIYFSDSISTSLKYTEASWTRPGRRLICISQVALGDSAKFYSYSTNLTQPPPNFHSTHGVKRTTENNSKFLDDEFVIYNLDQQRLLYIVEVSWLPHDDSSQSLSLLPIIRDDFSTKNTNKEISIPSTIEDEIIQVAEQDYGLICPSSGQLVPLKAFHIRAQLVDVTAEVVLYQVYHNTSSIPIEAKYVFPLEENCSVCGFEAHINNKIIKGVVKEKEQAKREYREAIAKGHGAYLMHQEQPEVFSVSVGNLPANCEVIIKITYVAELPIENNDIIFRFPAKIASWQSKQALESKDQSILPSIDLSQANDSMKSVEFSLKTSIRMPYEILKIFSPTHRLRRKVTDCISMIELVDNVLLEKDFLLSITLKTMNLPRMLNEISDENTQACMLTFYPKFEMTKNPNDLLEIIFLIDVSNSMDGKHVQQAKQLAHLFLTNFKQDGNIYFNIVTFGSDNDECFPISVPNTKENIEKAKHFVLYSLDHRGNTDLYSVLRQLSLFPSISKLGRQYILLSDGHINEFKSIATFLKNQPSTRQTRLFTCSIGETANKYQLKQLANQTNAGGLCTIFDSNYRSRWKSKVVEILEHIHQPCVTNVSIDWHGTIDQQQELLFTNQAPKIIRSLFDGMRLTVYRFIDNCHRATLKATINDQEFLTDVFSNRITETKGRILHCLTARAIISDYENGLLSQDESENELIKKQNQENLIRLSCKHSVVCSLTSFVAIEERDDQPIQTGVRLLDVMLENEIDLLPYINWEGERSQIDLVKDKLINGKRQLDNASITNKTELTHQYEQLCQNVSYRSGGDPKYQLMLTIIDTYQTVLKDDLKAQQLIDEMKTDLSKEIGNATAEDREILEKQLDEINQRFIENESSETESEIEYDDEEEEEEEKEKAEEHEDHDFSKILMKKMQARRCLIISNIAAQSTSSKYLCDFDDELFSMPPKSAAAKADTPTKKEEKEGWSSDDDAGTDMGFGLFDDYDSYSPRCSTATIQKPTVDPPAAKRLQEFEAGDSQLDLLFEVQDNDCALPEIQMDAEKSIRTALDKVLERGELLQAIETPQDLASQTHFFKTLSLKKSLPLRTSKPSVESVLSTSTLQQTGNILRQPTTTVTPFGATTTATTQMKQPTLFSFGGPPPPPPPPHSSGLFSTITAASTPVMPFGGFLAPQPRQSMQSITPFSFGIPPPPPPLPPSMGAGTTSLFEGLPPPPPLPPSMPAGTASLFGGLPPPPPLPPSMSAATTSLFGGLPPPPQSSNLTWTTTAASTPVMPQATFGLFGGPPPPVQPSGLFSSNSFGGSSPPLAPMQAAAAFSFGAKPLAPPSTGLSSFSTTENIQQSSGFSFGNQPPPPPQAPGFAFTTTAAKIQQLEKKTPVLPNIVPAPSPPLSELKPSLDEMFSNEEIEFDLRSQSSSRRRASRGRGSPIMVSSYMREAAKKGNGEITTNAARFCDTRQDEQSWADENRSALIPSSSTDDFSVRDKRMSKKKVSSYVPIQSPVHDTKISDLLLLDVIPLSLGVEDITGHMHPIIIRNTTIPTRSQSYPLFTNAYAYQKTATIRIFEGEHKLTKYNTLLGELILKDLTPNYTSQALVISVYFDVDANGILEVIAEETRSGAQTKLRITNDKGRLSAAQIEEHIRFVESNANFRATPIRDRDPNDSLYQLAGETENSLINFTFNSNFVEQFQPLQVSTTVALTVQNINQLKTLQQSDGSFELNDSLANIFMANTNSFDEFKRYLFKQGFSSFALSIQNEILRLIATGIFLMECFFQIEVSARETYLIPFDKEQIQSIFHRCLPKNLVETADKAIDFFARKRLQYGIYCEQLELSYSSWEKFIQYSIFNFKNEF